MPKTPERRLFDLEAANRTLPLVSRIVADAMRVHEEMLRVHGEAHERAEAGDRENAERLQDRLQELAYERAEFLAELEELGCEFKGFEGGLVDFPSRHDGRVVYLCWAFGEGGITHWHEVADGFAGRRVIDDPESFRGA